MKLMGVKRLCMILLVTAALLLPAACASMHKSQMDTSIESSIRNSTAYKTHLQNDAINVLAEDGKVTLTGTVPDESKKMLAQDVAESISGVKSVDNKLQVEGGSPREGSDAWLGAKVKAEILSHPEVGAPTVDVYVKDGVVTLQGQANNEAQRSLMTEYAKNVKNVKRVINEMTVASVAPTQPETLGAAIDDATITAQAQLALVSNDSTRNLDTAIDTTNGVVTVRGNANTLAEKELVSSIINNIEGVKGVNNEMLVSEPATFTK